MLGVMCSAERADRLVAGSRWSCLAGSKFHVLVVNVRWEVSRAANPASLTAVNPARTPMESGADCGLRFLSLV